MSKLTLQQYSDHVGQEEIQFPDRVAKNKFVEAMNKRAKQIGMSNTNFVEPAGYPSTNEHVMSTGDMVKLVIQASGYKELARVWNKKSYTFQIEGKNARELTIDTTVSSDLIEYDYYIFGGKTGSISGSGEISGYHLVLVTSAPNGNRFVASVRNASSASDRFKEMKKTLDNAKLLLNDRGAVTQDINAESSAVSLMPLHNPFSYEQYDIPLLFSKNADEPGHPASVTKVMSAILFLDYLHELDEKIVFKSSDLVPGSGSYFKEGDIITLKDALYCMMLPSSNQATHAVARVVGNKMLNKQ